MKNENNRNERSVKRVIPSTLKALRRTFLVLALAFTMNGVTPKFEFVSPSFAFTTTIAPSHQFPKLLSPENVKSRKTVLYNDSVNGDHKSYMPATSSSAASPDKTDQNVDLELAAATRSDSVITPVTVTQEGEATIRLGGAMTNPTVWSEFAKLSADNPDLANLGQGFPDWLPPQFALDSLVEASMDVARSPHQYTRTAGHPSLVRQLAGRYSKHLGVKVDPMSMITVTVGASQALYVSLQTLVQPGDEVILLEPFFDLYENQIKLAGGTPVYVPLTFEPYDNNDNIISGGEWKLDPEAISSAVSSKTRAIILNSPHNPTGKVFTRTEMEFIADAVIAAGPQCIVLSDEVYKYIVHSPPKSNTSGTTDSTCDTDENSGFTCTAAACTGHEHFASLPGMWDRTITISSAGKTFSATGWQVGWAVGPEHLISPIHQLMPYVQFCASTVMQEALARTLNKADEAYLGYENYYQYLMQKYKRKRDLLGNALNASGFAIPDYDITPGGGFFIFARIGKSIRNVLPRERINVENKSAPGGIARMDWALCQWMAEEKGILCIPASPFFSKKSAEAGVSDEFVRIAFCKSDETIERAAERLLNLVTSSSGSPTDGKSVDINDFPVEVNA